MWKENKTIHITVKVIPNPIKIKTRSSSKSPIQMMKILRAGIKFENGIGKGSDKKPADTTIDRPQMI